MSGFSYNFPVVMTANGLQPQAPQSILTQLIADVSSTNPGYTANLPGTLLEDISSTDVAAIALCDSAKVESVNCITPNGANMFVLTQQGSIYGVYQGTPAKTSVLVQFSGTVGYVINNGFLVSDGSNAYQVQGGGPILSGGTSAFMTAVAVSNASFSVPANTVNAPITTFPNTVSLAVNNPNPGFPGTGPEPVYSWRSRVLQAGLTACTGTSRCIKTLLGQLLGSQSNLISVQQASGGGLRVVVGGSADVYALAYAIWQGVLDPTRLVGSAISNTRNVTVSLNDYPDTYAILYVSAVAQTVALTVTWNTTLPNFTGGSTFANLVQGPLTAYINALAVGQVINVMEMNAIFQQAVSSVLDPQLLTRLVFAVYINTTLTPPGTGTYAVTGDPEGYFNITPSNIVVTQG